MRARELKKEKNTKKRKKLKMGLKWAIMMKIKQLSCLPPP